MSYNCNDYRHILKGSDEFIKIGNEKVKDVLLPEGITFGDNLLFQLGEAISNNDEKEIDELYQYCVSLSNELK